jgi:MerR HTH family regulatory protein
LARGAITVQDVARRIARKGEDQQVVIERIRHWTRERLLGPSTWPRLSELGLHPGTGRYRSYDDEAVYRAAVLNALVTEGATVRHLRMVTDALNRLGKHEQRLWSMAKAGKASGKNRVLMLASLSGHILTLVQGMSEVGRLLTQMDANGLSGLMIVNLELLAKVKSS